MRQSYKVAVVGGGTAGLVTAIELQREGHHATVFEKADNVGGTWLCDSRVETDLLALDPNRKMVHSSLYRSLRVNLPRQIMGFLDYPFVRKEMLRFLEDFARDFGLMEMIRFGNEVVRVELVDEVSHEWVLESRTQEIESNWESKEVFEAVVICNEKFTEARIAGFSGLFEKASSVGGTRLYNSRVETDLLGLQRNREIVHSSLYRSFRVNLPRQIMGFLVYPFVKKQGGDQMDFPGHEEEVLRFLEDFARNFGLMELIRFGNEVVRMELVDEVSQETESNWESKEEVFETVVICNGKPTEPKIAEFSGGILDPDRNCMAITTGFQINLKIRLW